MSTVTGVSNNSTSGATDATTATTTTGQKTLGQDDFLKLLAQQFQSQDPMKPMDDTSFIAEMAQFTALQQQNSMSTNISSMKADQQLATANTYLGHHVTVDDGNGGTTSGDVTGVEITDGTPRLVIGNYTYPVSSVVLVEPAAVSTTTPANSTAQ